MRKITGYFRFKDNKEYEITIEGQKEFMKKFCEDYYNQDIEIIEYCDIDSINEKKPMLHKIIKNILDDKLKDMCVLNLSVISNNTLNLRCFKNNYLKPYNVRLIVCKPYAMEEKIFENVKNE